MDCQSFGRDLEAYLDAELEATRAALLEGHAADCPACAARLAEAQALGRIWRESLRAEEGAPPELGERIRMRLGAETPVRRDAWIRALGSPWAPRLAMAAVLALVVLVPLVVLVRGAPAQARAAAERHACHAPAPGGALPPCCTALGKEVGDALGPPTPGYPVPDLRAAGLVLVSAVRCTYPQAPVNALTYADREGRWFSLALSAGSPREFKLLRPTVRDGIAQVRHAVDVQGGPDAPVRLEVALWLDSGRLLTWVGPPGEGFEAGRRLLQARF